MILKIAIGTDHGGFHLKAALIRLLKWEGHRVQDLGTFSERRCDYPPIGAKVARTVSEAKADRGLLLCKSGAGMAIVANKFPGVRAAVCPTIALAKHAREHNDSNVLVLAANHTSVKQAQAILEAWLREPFAGGRHARRLRQIAAIERKLKAIS